MPRTHFLCALLILLAVGCQHQPKYGWVYDKKADFSKLKTYQWLAAVQKGTAGRDIGGVPIDKLIEEIVDSDLAAKGFVKAPPGTTPDFTIRSTSVLEFRESETSGGDITQDDSPIDGDRSEVVSSAPDIQPGVPSSYKVGTVYLSVSDPKTHTLLWRGVGSAVLREQATDEQRRKRLEENIHKLLANFPPAPKK